MIGGHKALIGYSLEPGYDRFRPPSGSKIDLGFVLYVEEVFKVSIDSIAVSLFVDDILVELTNIRRQDPNNYSDTETRCLV